MSTGDARAGAWLSAWNALRSASDLRADFRQKADDPNAELPQDYHDTLHEVQLLAALASVDQSVGMMAYDAIEEERREKRLDGEAFLEAMRESKEADSLED